MRSVVIVVDEIEWGEEGGEMYAGRGRVNIVLLKRVRWEGDAGWERGVGGPTVYIMSAFEVIRKWREANLRARQECGSRVRGNYL